MTRSHFQSILFAAVLLGSVAITYPGRYRIEATTSEGAIAASSLTPAGEPAAPSAVHEGFENPARSAEPSLNLGDQLTAESILVAPLDGGIAIRAKHPNQRWPLASLTKLMTAAVATELFLPDQRIRITAGAVAADGDIGNLAPGESFAVSDLIRIMLLTSSNDAAAALADAAGSAAFLGAMREKAAALRMSDTSFADPTGISYLNQSTASDIAVLARYLAAAHPELFAATRLAEASITEQGSGRPRIVRSNNQFAGNPGFLGGKTGYTDEANGNLLTIMESGSTPLIFIVLGSDDRFGETLTLYDSLASR